MSKKAKSSIQNSKKFHFGILDWFCILFGLSMSIITPFLDYTHSQIYIIVSIVMLICGLFEIILGIKGRRSNYIFAIINTFASVYIAWIDQFYGNMAINAFYIFVCLFGFYSWGKHRDRNKDVIARKLTIRQILIAAAIFIVVSMSLNIALEVLGGHATPLDSTSTILIIFASILGALRYREQWILWAITNMLTCIMWIGTGNPAAIAMHAFYVVTSIYGYFNWRKLIGDEKM